MISYEDSPIIVDGNAILSSRVAGNLNSYGCYKLYAHFMIEAVELTLFYPKLYFKWLHYKTSLFLSKSRSAGSVPDIFI
jgi:hypothetical protein